MSTINPSEPARGPATNGAANHIDADALTTALTRLQMREITTGHKAACIRAEEIA